MINADSPRALVQDAIAHLDHVLPGQAPIHSFVHHNTLHGFQHLPFEQALRAFHALTGVFCYLSDDQFRDLYRQGRIDDDDVEWSLAMHLNPQAGKQDGAEAMRIEQQRLYRMALLEDLNPITPARLRWLIDERGLLDDDADAQRWQAILDTLALPKQPPHPEDLLDFSDEQAESWLPSASDGMTVGEQDQRQDIEALERLFASLGDNLTLRGLLQVLTGIDILDTVRPQLIRICGSQLDEGIAAWTLPERDSLGLYRAWRQHLTHDNQPFLQELPDWQALVDQLPEDATDAIVQQLSHLRLPCGKWSGYLQRIALEIPGWAGLLNWRQQHASYRPGPANASLLTDYLALRLVLDHAHAQQLCRTVWHCEARLDKLAALFKKQLDEFSVRRMLFAGELPEYLTQPAYDLIHCNSHDAGDWQALIERIRTWRHSPLADRSPLNACQHGWRLFKLSRAMNLDAPTLRTLGKTALLDWLERIDRFDAHQRAYVWLCAFERHYREQVLDVLHANSGRGRWARRDSRPSVQAIFCMDEREESFRRHLEECNPDIETLGAAGFFGIAMNYRGLDDHHVTPLCPVVVTPSHDVAEGVAPQDEAKLAKHRRGVRHASMVAAALYQALRLEPLIAYVLAFAVAPLKFARLLGKTLMPTWQRRLEQQWQGYLVPPVTTHLQLHSDDERQPTPADPKPGFSNQEQADRIAQFLKTTGLTYGFAPIVAVIGHGSTSQNNPHEAAHDCGACGGRRGGPNARAFAAMANRAEVRQLLQQRGIVIPGDTWFVGAQHDTCSDVVTWYDLDQVPEVSRAALTAFQQTLLEADRRAAQERCRRFASAGQPKTPWSAIRHVENRAQDLSQVRPEFGHATNAAAYIGRRSATRGAFFDRRLFLISYDPTQDADGTILENILLTAGPVGAGINLEYYFSSVDNERLGCSTKIPHNVTGLFGVMEGASSDLRTGLPLQMVEIHEAMRLQVIVEAKTAILERLYGRQPALQELIGGGWIHLIAQDPDSGAISVFERGIGFVAWQPRQSEVDIKTDSLACFQGRREAVAPLLIAQAEAEAAVS